LKQANFNGNSPYGDAATGTFLRRTCKVGSYKPNAFGLYDMHGNVEEWCQDTYDKKYYATSPKKDPVNAVKGDYRILRGGSWMGVGVDCRSACRQWNGPGGRHYTFGFRVVLVPPGK
jgi:formylglycine-generating enzyme required for sulfatase activity